jgi:eukaryotic-like serine/threonine-protein kinase
MNLAELATLFPDYSDFQAIPIRSGQKEVIRALLGTRRVAIKLFHSSVDDEERIAREIAAVSKLHCPSVPEVISSGRVTLEGVERVYLVEQFIEGETYAAVLHRDHVRPVHAVADLANVLLRVSEACEGVGLVHRDLKPQNLIYDPAGHIWVLDFGIAKHLDLTTLTPTGQAVGTLGYAPMEQLRLMKAEINIRADLFAIGTVMYESIYGQNPWRQGTQDAHDLIRKMSTQELPRLAINGDINGELSSYIAWLTQRFPSRRPQSAIEAMTAFEPIYQKLAASINRE